MRLWVWVQVFRTVPELRTINAWPAWTPSSGLMVNLSSLGPVPTRLNLASSLVRLLAVVPGLFSWSRGLLVPVPGEGRGLAPVSQLARGLALAALAPLAGGRSPRGLAVPALVPVAGERPPRGLALADTRPEQIACSTVHWDVLQT